MAHVRNISNGPRGVWLKGVLATVDPGKTVDADDWNEEWFTPAEGTVDETDLEGLGLAGLVKLAVAEGVLESEENACLDLRRAITSKREFEAARATAEHDDNASAEPGPLDGSVDDLVAHLEGVTDPDAVQALIDAETAGKSRKGALAALEARRDELLA